MNHYCVIFLSGRKLGYTFDSGNFHNVSLGQGQEVVAEQALDLAANEGHWVILQVFRYTRIHAHTHYTHTTHKQKLMPKPYRGEKINEYSEYINIRLRKHKRVQPITGDKPTGN